MPSLTETISATEFKARCLEMFDRLAARKIDRVVVTKRGRPVAVLTPPDPEAGFAALHGFLRGSVRIPEGVDLTAPVLDEALNAEEGRIHE
jgi:prevent-host-death family protein